jgi:hypothetical protein
VEVFHSLATLFLLAVEVAVPHLTLLLALVAVQAVAVELLLQPEVLETRQAQHQVKVTMAVQEVVGALVVVVPLLLVAMEMLQ